MGKLTTRAGAGTLLAIKVAHSLYRRWERLAPAERERLRGLAERAKDGALDLRGRVDRQAAEADLARASRELAAAIGEAAAADPAATTAEIEALRAELALELDRIARREPPAQAA
jgi:hypothetical protein